MHEDGLTLVFMRAAAMEGFSAAEDGACPRMCSARRRLGAAGRCKAEAKSQAWKAGGFLGGGHERVPVDSGISEECEIV